MKKKHLVIFVCLLMGFLSVAQAPYYDAIQLINCIDKSTGKFMVIKATDDSTTKASKRKIIEKYCKILKSYTKLSTDKPQVILNEYRNLSNDQLSNPFIKPFIDDGNLASETFGGVKVGAVAGNAISSLGGLDVTNFADGLAKFLVKRAKQELSIAFFKKFKKDLEDSTYIELRTLFPQTVKTLRLIDTDIYDFTAYLNTLREVFAKDLSNAFANTNALFYLPAYREYFKNNSPDLGTAIYSALHIIGGLSDGKHPGDILAEYNADTLINFCRPSGCPAGKMNLETDARASMKTLKILSASFRSVSATNYWVPADSVKAMVSDLVAFRIYLGLVYMQAKNEAIIFHNSSLVNMMNKVALAYDSASVTVSAYRTYVTELAKKAQAVDAYIKAVREKAKADRDLEDYFKIVDGTMEVMGMLQKLPDLPYINFGTEEGETKRSFSQMLSISRSVSDLYTDMRQKNYSSLVIDVISLIDLVTDGKEAQMAMILKYGTFVASVAQAKNSEEVEAAIEAIALPPGSYRIKREAAGNTSINAYVGPFAGGEVIVNAKNESAPVYGITAPVGLSFSALNCSSKKYGSSSLFISVLDIGAVTAFRFKNDTIAQVPTIKLRNIFSPGVFYSYGIPGVPLSINLGAQIGPNLRNVSSTTNSYADHMYLRYSVSVVVDIPLLNIRTRPHTSK